MDSTPSSASIEDVQLQTVDELPKGLSSLLTEVHDVAGRSLQSTLREWAKAALLVERQPDLQAPYSEFTRTLELPVAIASVDSPALAAPFVVCMDGRLSSSVTDLLLGGQIREPVDRWPTTTDIALRSGAIEELLKPLHDAFRPVLPLDAKISRFESSPNFIFDIGPDDPVIVYTFAVSLGDQAAGDLSVIYPFAALQPPLDEVNVGTVEPPTIFEPSVVQLEEVEVELLALIGPTSVAVGDFLSLQPGDVLVLDQWADQPSIGMVHGVPLLELSVGASSGHVAAVVERWKE